MRTGGACRTRFIGRRGLLSPPRPVNNTMARMSAETEAQHWESVGKPAMARAIRALAAAFNKE